MRGASLCVAAAALSSVASAAGVTITVTHDLDAARPAAVVAVPFAEIAQARARPAHVPRDRARSEGPRIAQPDH